MGAGERAPWVKCLRIGCDGLSLNPYKLGHVMLAMAVHVCNNPTASVVTWEAELGESPGSCETARLYTPMNNE